MTLFSLMGTIMTASVTWQEHYLIKGDLTLVLLPGIGGRLIDIRFQGQSLLFNNPDLSLIQFNLNELAELPTKAKHFPFPLWGGEKTWVAPNNLWPSGAPYPLLDSGSYEFEWINCHSVSMTSLVCPISGLKIVRTISISSDKAATWSIHHSLKNCGEDTRYCGVWSVMMVRRPVTISYAQPTDTQINTLFGNHSGCIEAMDGYTAICCTHAQEFKVGVQPDQPSADCMMLLGGDRFLLNSLLVDMSAPNLYAHGHALEIYNSGHYDYAELEWHSPARHLAPGESIELEVSFDLSRI